MSELVHFGPTTQTDGIFISHALSLTQINHTLDLFPKEL